MLRAGCVDQSGEARVGGGRAVLAAGSEPCSRLVGLGVGVHTTVMYKIENVCLWFDTMGAPTVAAPY